MSYPAQFSRSRLLYCIASAKCSGLIVSLESRSAIDLETFNILSYARADKFSFSIAFFNNVCPVWSIRQILRSCRLVICALQQIPLLLRAAIPSAAKSFLKTSAWSQAIHQGRASRCGLMRSHRAGFRCHLQLNRYHGICCRQYKTCNVKFTTIRWSIYDLKISRFDSQN